MLLSEVNQSEKKDMMKIFLNHNLFHKNFLKRKRVAVYGNSGSGKTVTTAVLVEEADAVGYDCFIIDTEAEFTTLKQFRRDRFVVYGQKYSMKSKGINKTGVDKMIRRYLYEFKSVILNLRQYVRKDQDAIVLYTLRKLWQEIDLGGAPSRNRVLVIDEVHEFAPQNSVSNQELLEEIIRVMKKGRKRDYCGIIASQRPASVNKDVANQCEMVFFA